MVTVELTANGTSQRINKQVFRYIRVLTAVYMQMIADFLHGNLATAVEFSLTVTSIIRYTMYNKRKTEAHLNEPNKYIFFPSARGCIKPTQASY